MSKTRLEVAELSSVAWDEEKGKAPRCIDNQPHNFREQQRGSLFGLNGYTTIFYCTKCLFRVKLWDWKD